MGQHIKTNGLVEEVKPANGDQFTLDELQGFVGGMIEAIYLPSGNLMFCNEEGKLMGLEVNVIATVIASIPGDMIVGDVIVGTPHEMGEGSDD